MRRWIALLTSLLALTACTKNVARPPLLPAPIEEVDARAKEVLQAWHAVQTQAAWGQELVPLSDVIRLGEGDPGFTDQTRESYAHHSFELAGTLPTQAPPDARLSFPDGATMTVRVLDAQSTFKMLRQTPASDTVKDHQAHRGSPVPEEGTIKITGATLGQMRLRTNHGVIDAPAWVFTTRELRVPIVRLAVSTQSMTLPLLAVDHEPPDHWQTPVHVDRLDETHLSVVYFGGGGEDGWQVHAYQTAAEVVVGVGITRNGYGNVDLHGCYCAITLTLDSPLGDRVVLGIGGYLVPPGLQVEQGKIHGT